MNEVHQTSNLLPATSDLTRRLVLANFVRHVYQTLATDDQNQPHGERSSPKADEVGQVPSP
jgi:hypothetical protein